MVQNSLPQTVFYEKSKRGWRTRKKGAFTAGPFGCRCCCERSSAGKLLKLIIQRVGSSLRNYLIKPAPLIAHCTLCDMQDWWAHHSEDEQVLAGGAVCAIIRLYSGWGLVDNKVFSAYSSALASIGLVGC